MIWLVLLSMLALWFYARHRWATRCSECDKPLNWMAENGIGHHFGCADAWWERNRDDVVRRLVG